MKYLQSHVAAAPVDEYIALAATCAAVSYCAPAPVVERLAPAVSYTAPSPVVVYLAPARTATGKGRTVSLRPPVGRFKQNSSVESARSGGCGRASPSTFTVKSTESWPLTVSSARITASFRIHALGELQQVMDVRSVFLSMVLGASPPGSASPCWRFTSARSCTHELGEHQRLTVKLDGMKFTGAAVKTISLFLAQALS